jgi:hypothetical protein
MAMGLVGHGYGSSSQALLWSQNHFFFCGDKISKGLTFLL